MMSLDFGGHESPLLKLDGRTKLISLMAVFIVAIVFSDPLYALGLLVLALAAWWIGRLPWAMLKTILNFALVMALIILVVQLLFYPGKTNLLRISDPIGFLGFSGYITLEGVRFGMAMVFRLLVIMIIAPLMVMTTPLPEFMVALVKLKVPYRFAFIMTTALSLLPSIQNHASIIQQAQLCRGIADFETKNLFTKLRAMAGLLVPLILGTFRDSQTLDVAMSSRAFGAPVKRTFLLESHLLLADYIVLGVTALMLVAGIFLRVQGYGTI